MLRINDVKLPVDTDFADINALAAKISGVRGGYTARLVKKSIDARHKPDIKFICSFELECENDEKTLAAIRRSRVKCRAEKTAVVASMPQLRRYCGDRPLIIGAGPAGLFAALTLCERGARPIIIERGQAVDKRTDDVLAFWRGGALDPDSNVQFGEGGAGTFSDGKLTTGIKDIRCREVIKAFVRFGAESDVEYLAKPHIGTDVLKKILGNIRRHIEENGGEFRFGTRLTGIRISGGALCGAVLKSRAEEYQIDCTRMILAVGHSSRDTFEMLKNSGVPLEPKPFAMGVRIEHPQSYIDSLQYGAAAGSGHLPPADYKQAVHLPNGRTVYTFCMCPGGYVVAAASEPRAVATNGMSEYARNGENANSALLVNVETSDFCGDDVLAGVELQREIERRAYLYGGGSYKAPAQTLGDFLRGEATVKLGAVRPTYLPGVKLGDIAAVLPDFIVNSLREGIRAIDKRMSGFALDDALLTAPETRSSSPVRIIRDRATLQSRINGIFPCGEGAGYAGGIMSAAVDGIKCAEMI